MNNIQQNETGAYQLPKPVKIFDANEVANGERFAYYFEEEARYCRPWKKWLIWTGTHWARDENGVVNLWAEAVIHSIKDEAKTAPSEGKSEALYKHYTKSLKAASIDAMLKLAGPKLPISPDNLDTHPFLLNVQNGTIDLSTGDLLPHVKSQYLTKCLSLEFDPDAEAPTWKDFLSSSMDNNQALIDYVQCAVGYALTGDVREQVMFVLHGEGANGKGTLLETLLDLLGDYAMTVQTETFVDRKNGRMATDIARLFGVRFAVASETEASARLSEAMVKTLTGNDKLTGEKKYEAPFDFSPTHKLFFATNHLPKVKRGGYAIWRRLPLIPFTKKFWNPDAGETGPPELRRNKELTSQLRKEFPGILTWAVTGALRWKKDGLKWPEEVRQATDDYKDDQDAFGDFIDECCVVGKDEVATVADLYRAYCNWANVNGERPMSKREMGEQLKDRGYPGDRGGKGTHVRRGLSVKAEEQQRDSSRNYGDE